MRKVNILQLSAQFVQAARNTEKARAIALQTAGDIIEQEINAVAQQAAGGDRVLRNKPRAGPLGAKFVIKGQRGYTNAVGPWGIRDNSYVGGRTKAHAIHPRNANVLRWVSSSTGQTIYARRVRHPGSTRGPFWERGISKARPRVERWLPDRHIEAVAKAFDVPWKARKP